MQEAWIISSKPCVFVPSSKLNRYRAYFMLEMACVNYSRRASVDGIIRDKSLSFSMIPCFACR